MFWAARGDSEIEEASTRGYAEAGYSAALSRAADTLAARSRAANVAPWVLTSMYLRAGRNDAALEWLERSFEARDPNVPYMSVGPQWDGVRDDPRFQVLLRRMNLPM